MPNAISPEKIASLLTGHTLTSQVRSLRDDIDAVKDSGPMDWNEDLTALGIDATSVKVASLASAFGTVASESGTKYRAVVKCLDSGEVAVRFNRVKSR